MKAIKAQLVIDGTGKTFSDGVVLIENGRLKGIGSSGEVKIPEGCEVIDCHERTVLPAFVDPHTHATLDSTRDETITEQHDQTEGLSALRGLKSFKKDLDSGVTTMRSLGDPYEIDLLLRDYFAAGKAPGPRILACGQAIRPSHGTAFKTGVVADGPEEVRKVTRETIFHGADVIKLFVSNISRGRSHLDYKRGDLTRVPAYTKEEISAAVEEAHRSGIRVAVHAIGGPALRWALEAGVDSAEHVNLIEEKDIDLFLETGAYLSDPNLQLFFDDETGFKIRTADLPDWWLEKVRKSAEITQEMMQKVLEAGVKFALATDSNHGNIWREAYHMVNVLEADEMEAIKAITINGAEVCGLEKDLGTLESGKIADLVAIDGNPLEEIKELKKVDLVIKEGEIYNNKLEK